MSFFIISGSSVRWRATPPCLIFERVIHVFIASCLDYCNSLHVGSHQSSLRRLLAWIHFKIVLFVLKGTPPTRQSVLFPGTFDPPEPSLSDYCERSVPSPSTVRYTVGSGVHTLACFIAQTQATNHIDTSQGENETSKGWCLLIG